MKGPVELWGLVVFLAGLITGVSIAVIFAPTCCTPASTVLEQAADAQAGVQQEAASCWPEWERTATSSGRIYSGATNPGTIHFGSSSLELGRSEGEDPK